MTKPNLINWFIIALFLLALACGNGGSRPAASGSSGSQPAQEQPAQEAAAPPAAVGQDVTVGEARWKILEVRNLGQELKSDNEFIKPKTTAGKFILIRLEVENRKAEDATYGGINLVDGKGRKFERYTEQFGFVPEAESCVLKQLNPNLPATCSEIFELPADAAGLKALVGDLELFGSGEALVDLKL